MLIFLLVIQGIQNRKIITFTIKIIKKLTDLNKKPVPLGHLINLQKFFIWKLFKNIIRYHEKPLIFSECTIIPLDI